MLHLVLVDSELETIPKKISSDEAIRREAGEREKSATELILDSNYHHNSMDELEDKGRRGRPDIVHVCMLACLDSPLNREGLLEFCVHTRHDEVIDVDPEIRIPRSYNRFIGLMEQLFQEGGVPPDSPLMEIRDMSLAEKLDRIDPEETIAFSEKGKKVHGGKVFQGFEPEDDIAVLVGGFPHGDFISDVEGLSDTQVSIYDESLDAVTVAMHAIQFYEESFGII